MAYVPVPDFTLHRDVARAVCEVFTKSANTFWGLGVPGGCKAGSAPCGMEGENYLLRSRDYGTMEAPRHLVQLRQRIHDVELCSNYTYFASWTEVRSSRSNHKQRVRPSWKEKSSWATCEDHWLAPDYTS